MWSRRAQEYEAKINSGDIVAIAEVVRDLFRSESQPEQSYSERQLYEAALDRLSREIAAVQRITETEAVKEIEAALAKGPRRGPKVAEAEGARPKATCDAEGEDAASRHRRGRGGLSDLDDESKSPAQRRAFSVAAIPSSAIVSIALDSLAPGTGMRASADLGNCCARLRRFGRSRRSRKLRRRSSAF